MISIYKLVRKHFCFYLLSTVLFLFVFPGKSFSGNMFNSNTILAIEQERTVPAIPSTVFSNYFNNKEKEEESPISPLKNLTITGFYRALIYTRTLNDAYMTVSDPLRSVTVGDAFREPMLNLNVGAAPTKNTYFNYQMFFFPNYAGPTFDNKNLTLQFGVTLSGGIKTKIGKYDFTLGGANWQKLSKFTLWQNEGLNRFSTFDRRPWDDPTSIARYKDWNEQGTINQDVRWGRRPFQGVYMESIGMPGKLSTVFFYGKTDNSGGGSSFLTPKTPDQIFAGKLAKAFGRNSIGVNSFNRVANADSIKDIGIGYDVHTLEYVYFFKNIKFSGEIGAGSYYSPTHKRVYSDGVNLGFYIPKKFTKLPLNIQMFHIGTNFVNINTIVYNTSIAEAQQQSSTLANSQSLFPFNSPIVDIGQLTNNREGININTEFKIFSKIRFNIGYANTMEISRISNAVSYTHRVNGLTMSQINSFNTNIGPYNNISTLYRGYYETAHLSDTTANGKMAHDKHFNTLEVQGKYGGKFLQKSFFIFYNGFFNSVQSSFSLFNKMNDDAYMRVYSNEFDVYYNIFSRFTLVGYYGVERAIGNRFTDLNTSNPNAVSKDRNKPLVAPTNNPRDQTGQGIGFGFDIDLGKNVGLYYRQRWFDYSDKNFADDHYKGQEATVELKLTF